MALVDGLRIERSDDVYDPAEDSYLLAEVVRERAFGKTLDLGTGTGIQGIVAAMKGCQVTFADVSTGALALARRNAELNGVAGEFVRTDLFSGIGGDFNTLIFNPPYVPSAPLGNGDKTVHAALDGGTGGREVIDRFLSQYRRHVLADHIVLMVESSLDGYAPDVERLGATVVARSHFFFEDIVVLAFG